MPIEHASNPHNEDYLRAKRDKMGHVLHHQGSQLDEQLIADEKREDHRRAEGAE